jgi:hypothetical protein
VCYATYSLAESYVSYSKSRHIERLLDAVDLYRNTGTSQLCGLAYRASRKSMLINGSSPTTHASCPGGIVSTSPGRNLVEGQSLPTRFIAFRLFGIFRQSRQRGYPPERSPFRINGSHTKFREATVHEEIGSRSNQRPFVRASRLPSTIVERAHAPG